MGWSVHMGKFSSRRDLICRNRDLGNWVDPPYEHIEIFTKELGVRRESGNWANQSTGIIWWGPQKEDCYKPQNPSMYAHVNAFSHTYPLSKSVFFSFQRVPWLWLCGRWNNDEGIKHPDQTFFKEFVWYGREGLDKLRIVFCIDCRMQWRRRPDGKFGGTKPSLKSTRKGKQIREIAILEESLLLCSQFNLLKSKKSGEDGIIRKSNNINFSSTKIEWQNNLNPCCRVIFYPFSNQRCKFLSLITPRTISYQSLRKWKFTRTMKTIGRISRVAVL